MKTNPAFAIQQRRVWFSPTEIRHIDEKTLASSAIAPRTGSRGLHPTDTARNVPRVIAPDNKQGSVGRVDGWNITLMGLNDNI